MWAPFGNKDPWAGLFNCDLQKKKKKQSNSGIKLALQKNRKSGEGQGGYQGESAFPWTARS